MSRTVAVACQGGGSHTAFTAGVLRTLLCDDDSQIAALSGTSGGAVCAFLAWSALLDGGQDARSTAAARLEKYWNDVKAEPPYETLLDSVTVDMLRAWGRLGIVLEASPYLSPAAAFGRSRFLDLLRRTAPAPPTPYPDNGPRLLVSAADVNSGEFRVFHSHPNGNAPSDSARSTSTGTATGTGCSPSTRQSGTCPMPAADTPTTANRPTRFGRY
jgi:NTE family protein